MGTEILRPQGCFIERVRVSPCRRRNFYAYNYNNNYSHHNPNSNPNPRFNRKPSVRPDSNDQRKRQPLISKRSSSVDDFKTSKNHAGNNLVMDKVTILRRGESLDSKIKSTETVPVKKDKGGETVLDRLGPDPEMVPKQIAIVDLRSPVAGKCDVYAGSGFAVSPAPSSLPLPSFSKKKQVPFDDSATRDLRRLLRLDV